MTTQTIERSVLGRANSAGRVVVSVLLVGLIVQLNSERAYWFYSTSWWTTDAGEMLGTAAFYAAAASAALWLLGRVTFRGAHQVVLAGALFAWTVEGVIVYVLHEAGPLDPFFPAMFAGWHGLLSFFGFFYLVRRWLVERRVGALAAVATGYGVFWGLWAVTSWLPDSDSVLAAAESGSAAITGPFEFAVTALLIVATLGVAHLALDRIWPGRWHPSRVSGWIVLGVTALWAAASYFAIPWAPLRWFALVGLPMGALVASNRGSAGPNLYAALDGSVVPSHLLALLPAALASSVVYLAFWLADPPLMSLETLQFSSVMVQMTAGAGALVWAGWRSLRRPPTSSM